MGEVPRSQAHPEGPLPPLRLLFLGIPDGLALFRLIFQVTVILWYFPVTVSAYGRASPHELCIPVPRSTCHKDVLNKYYRRK